MDAIRTTEAAKLLQVSVKTLRRWDASGWLVAHRYPAGQNAERGGTWFYYREELEAIMGRTPDDGEKE